MNKQFPAVVILGAGVSGQAAAALARSQGRRVTVCDEAQGEQGFAECLETGQNGEDALWVVSPGFPQDHPWCAVLRNAGADLIPELEFGASFLRGELLVITGSLGKTSMVMLAADLLRSAGLTATVSGNIGVPVSDIARESPEADVHVIEASSFQLETLRAFHPRRAVCLNLFPNHLDRHGSLAAYARAKATLFLNMDENDIAVWPEAFPVPVVTRARRRAATSEALPALEGTVFAQGPLRENLSMLMAALEGIPGISSEQTEQTVRRFRFPEHRMQILDLPGLGLVMDDSKSTCYAATRAALETVPGRVHLFMGGLDKGQSTDELTEIFRKRNPCLYLFGASGKIMRKAWQDSVDVCILEDSLGNVMRHLVTHRISEHEPVIFSPGCASFDQFQDYSDRGRQFRHLIHQHLSPPPIC